MGTVVIGIGNPVLSDDSVGLKIVRDLERSLAGAPGVVCKELYSGGMRLMEEMAGYQRAVIVDAVVSEGGRPGDVYPFDLSAMRETRNTNSSHDASFAVALELGRLAGLDLPAEISVWGVEAGDVETVSEELTPEVARAAPDVARRIGERLRAGYVRPGEEKA